MGYVGLLYVGAVLFMNGLMLLGKVEPKAAAVFNLFIGALQVITPTYLIFSSANSPSASLFASGLYLFGFTYLYVGIGILANLDTTGVGYFSLFVSIAALGYSVVNFRLVGDAAFGVIWLYWSFLWALFFVVLGLKKTEFTRYTGWVTAIEGWVTGVIPAFLLLTGYWRNVTASAIALAAFGLAVFAVLYPLTGPPAARRQPAHP